MVEWDYEKEVSQLADIAAGNAAPENRPSQAPPPQPIVAMWDFKTALGDTMKEKLESLFLKILEIENYMSGVDDDDKLIEIRIHPRCPMRYGSEYIARKWQVRTDASVSIDHIVLRNAKLETKIVLLNAPYF